MCEMVWFRHDTITEEFRKKIWGLNLKQLEKRG